MHLESLDVSNNLLEKWPGQLESCAELRDLRLDHNKIREVSNAPLISLESVAWRWLIQELALRAPCSWYYEWGGGVFRRASRGDRRAQKPNAPTSCGLDRRQSKRYGYTDVRRAPKTLTLHGEARRGIHVPIADGPVRGVATWPKFAQVPEGLDGNSALTYLNLSDNAIRRLPVAINSLSSLASLDVSRNELETTEIQPIRRRERGPRLDSLETLRLAHNQLREAQPGIETLTTLTELE